MAKPTIIIDGDILLWKSVTSSIQEFEVEDGVWTYRLDMDDAKDAFSNQLRNIRKPLSYPDYHLALSGDTNFRKELYADYKANRAARKPLGLKVFKEWMVDTQPTLSKPNIEADDVLGILATKPGNEGIVLWSIDKDLMQIPGKHLVDGEIVDVSEQDGDYRFYTQVLTGDMTDNYPGCKGIGKAKAEKILFGVHPPWGKPEEVWPAIVEAYKDNGFDEGVALVQARLARILRWNDWDNSKQEVKLWSPYVSR